MKTPAPKREEARSLEYPFFMVMLPKIKLDTSIPNATTVIIVPSTVLLEKLSTIGEARVWTTPRQNVIADPIAASKKNAFLLRKTSKSFP